MAAELAELITELFDPDSRRRIHAAEQIARLGADARPAAVNLVKACGDEVEEVREHVTAALEELGPPRPEDSFLLPTLLHNPSPDVGYWAATLLGRLKQDAADAVPGLAAVVAGVAGPLDMIVRQRAAWALGEIGPAAASALDALKQAECEADSRLSRLARQAIEKIGG